MKERMAPEEFELQGSHYTFYKPSEMDEAGIRTFVGIFAVYFLRAHGMNVPPQLVSARSEEERLFGQGPVPDLGGLPECLSADEVAEVRLTDDERKTMESWSTLWDDQDDQTRWKLVKKCAIEHLLENDYEVPRAYIRW
jgi:hypothetical protein